MLIIIIGLLLCYHYYFLSYIRLQSSPVEHENLSLKLKLQSDSTNFLEVIILYGVQCIHYTPRCVQSRVCNAHYTPIVVSSLGSVYITHPRFNRGVCYMHITHPKFNKTAKFLLKFTYAC